jgi:Flp pilus assembly protein TadG
MSLLFGVYEFSFFFYQQQLISTGVRDAARYLGRYNYTNTAAGVTSQCTILDTAHCSSLATAEGYAECIAMYGGTICTGSPRVSGWTSTGTFTITYTPDANSGASTPCGSAACNTTYSSVYSVQVSVSFADPSLGLLGFLGLTGPTITIAHTERVIGPG